MRLRRVTADEQIEAVATSILGLLVVPDGSNVALVDVYNEASSDKTAASKVAAVRTTATESQQVIFPRPVHISEGLYVDITTAGTMEVFLYLP